MVAGEFVTATATDQNGNTSEFALNVVAAANSPPIAANDSYTISEDTSLDSNDLWFDSNWSFRRTLTFDNTAQAGDLNDVPVLITLDATRIDYAQTQNNGNDLRFVDGDGTLLAYEIEDWNESGTSYVWVKLPQIDGGSATDFVYMYYGNSGAAAGEDPTNVWDANHQAVWHLSETSGAHADSTANGYGINTFSGVNQNATGQIDGANNFDGFNDYMWRAGDGTSLQIKGDVTLEAWVWMDNLPSGDWAAIVELAGAGTDVAAENYLYTMSVHSDGEVALGHESGAGVDHWIDTGVILNTSQWYHLTAVRDATALEWTLFVNGAQAGPNHSYTQNATGGSNSDVWVGWDFNHFDGTIDEIRISDTTRSAEWIAAQYASGFDSLIAYGYEQSVAGVLGNDLDPEGDPLTAIQVSSDPVNALSFTFNPDGSFTYTPLPDFFGVDSFTYTANDGSSDSNLATVTINVTAVNDIPTLTNFASFVETTNEDIEVEVTLAELKTQGDEADMDGTVDAFVVQSVASGTLRIGTTAGTATAWAAGTNDTIDATNNAYWTPDLNVSGTQNAFDVVAEDNLAAESIGNVLAQINVTPVNDIPTLASFAAVIDTTAEDTEVEVTFAELAAQGDEADMDGTVDAFVVQSVASGTLRIGTTAGTATAWAAGTNDTIDATNNAYWTPDLNVSGTQNAFDVVAEDNLAAESIGNVLAQINVTPVNDIPTLASFAAVIDTTAEDTEVEVTFAELAAQGDEADMDGTVDAFVVQSVASGTLRIGTTAGTATAWAAGTNDTIDATNNAYWTPDLNVSGTQNAFDVVAEDNLAAESIGNVLAQINVTPVNDIPTLASFAAVIDTTAEDAEVEVTFAELAAQGDEADIDGTVSAFVVKSVASGTLRIGTTAGTATAWGAGTNDTIDATNSAYWTPDLNISGAQNAFDVVAEDNLAAESVGNVLAQINVTPVNDIPTLTSFAAVIDTTAEDAEVEVTFAELAAQGDEADIDGTVSAFVVKSVASGTLRIGTTAGTATAWGAGTNDTIDATNSAYWTPDLNISGAQNAFDVVAEDNLAAESVGNVLAQINVTPVNDIPTLTSFAAVIDTTAEDAEVEVTFAELAAQGDEADIDGTVSAFVVKGIASGTLRIGTTAGTATAWVAGTNDTIDATNNAYWTPDANVSGTQNAFDVVAEDNLAAESVGNVLAQINVTPVNDIPTLTSFAGVIDTTAEDTEVEVTFAELAAQGDEADIDGTVSAFVVKGIASGTLRIGTTVGTATAWVAGTNDTIDATNNAYWTPDANVSGTQNAWNAVAKDNLAAESIGNVLAQISVTPVNDVPTLTSFAGVIDTTAEDTEVEVTFAELAAQGNEADIDGTVSSFVVQSVASGTLRIGTTAGTATAWVAGVNDTIDATNNAYWTPDLNVSGTQNAWDAVAKDNLAAESVGNVLAQISVTPVNDVPTLTSFAGVIDTTAEDTEVEVTFAELAAQGDEADIDGTVSAFVVKGIASGTLRIGTTVGTATAWVAGTNDTIDATNNAYWSPDANVSGTQNAWDAVAKDNLAAESVGNVLAQINVTPVNDKPVATANSYTVDADSTLTILGIGVLSNDSDVESDPLTAVQVGGPGSGTLTLSSNGSFVYTPNDGFSGIDSFIYVANDGFLNSDPVTVTITVSSLAVNPTVGPVIFVSPPTPDPSPAADPPPDTAPSPDADPPPLDAPIVSDEDGRSEGLRKTSQARPQPTVASPVIKHVSQAIVSAEESSAEMNSLLNSKKDSAERIDKPEQSTISSPGVDLGFEAEGRSLWKDLDQLGEQMDAHAVIPDFVIGSAAGLTTSLSVGYVVWLVRGGHILAGLMAQLPAWQLIDPLPILGTLMSEEDDEEDDSLESLVGAESDDTEDASLSIASESQTIDEEFAQTDA